MAKNNNKNGNGSVEKLLDVHKIGAIIKKNWMVLKRDKMRLVMLLLFPLVMITIFGYTSGEAPKHIPAALVDYDNSPLSLEVASQLYANELFSIKHLLGSQDEGRKLIDSGEIKILFIIPPGFEKEIDEGKTASLSVIIDQSDPTIAQTTRASTQIFIQQLSGQITAKRIAAVSLGAGRAGGMIADAKGNVRKISEKSDETALAKIAGKFSDAKSIYSKTDTGLSSTLLNLENSLGYVIDQNEIADSFGGLSDNEITASLSALSAGDAQQAVMQQIGVYGGLKAANARLYSDTAGIYSGSQELQASAAGDRKGLAFSLEILDSAGKKIEEVGEEAQKAATTPLSLNEIEPYGNGRPGLDFLIPNILSLIVFQGAVMGMGRAVAGERRDGSLTRVFLTPTSNITIITGTLLFYIIFESVRSSLIVFAAMILFGVTIKGSVLSILFLIAIYAAGATGVGMILSVIARSQEQYMAIGMIVTLPTMFLAGVFLPVETMPQALQGLAKALPITYAADAMRGVMIKGFELGVVMPDILFLLAFAMLTIALSILLFKRELL